MDAQEFLGQLVASVLPVLQLAVLAVVGWAAKELSTYIRQRIGNETAAAALDRLNSTVWDVVLELEQTMVAQLKRATEADSPGGARITKEEGVDVLEEALARIKALYGQEGLDRLLQVLGLSGDPESALRRLLTTKVESAVQQLKLEQGPKLTALAPDVGDTDA